MHKTTNHTIVGALTIMMASGAIVDFDVTENDDEVYVRVWPPDDGRARRQLQKHVAAILPAGIEERHVTVASGAAARLPPWPARRQSPSRSEPSGAAGMRRLP